MNPKVNDPEYIKQVWNLIKFIHEEDLATGGTEEVVKVVYDFYTNAKFFPDKGQIQASLSDQYKAVIKVDPCDDIAQEIRTLDYNYRQFKLSSLAVEFQTEVNPDKRREVLNKMSLYQNSLTMGSNLIRVGDIKHEEFKKSIEEKPLGIKLGVDALDSILYGVGYGRLLTVMAGTSNYKSMFGWNIVMSALDLNYNTLGITLEVSREEVLLNLVARHSYVLDIEGGSFSSENVKKHEVSSDVFDFVYEDFMKRYGDRLMILEHKDLKGVRSPDDLESLLSKIDEDFQFDVLLLDYLQLFKSFAPPSRRLEYLENYIIAFQRMSVSLNGNPRMVVLLSQVKRKAYEKALKNGGRYDVTDMSDTSELEKSSNYIMSLFKDRKEAGSCIYQLLKNRHGAVMEDVQSMFVEPASYYMGNLKDGDDYNALFSPEGGGDIIAGEFDMLL